MIPGSGCRATESGSLNVSCVSDATRPDSGMSGYLNTDYSDTDTSLWQELIKPRCSMERKPIISELGRILLDVRSYTSELELIAHHAIE